MFRCRPFPWLLGLAVFVPPAARAHVEPRDAVGSLVSVAVEVEGRPAPLYRAPDGSGRFYLEALPRRGYAVALANRTGYRLAVAVVVDGLNAVSGERETARRGSASPGRMYVLGPWERITVRGWRTSLDEVRRFTFVDEERSYAARSGKANAKMGWIELAVYRERTHYPAVTPRPRGGDMPPPAEGDDESARSEPPAAVEGERSAGVGARRSYPGTGWGSAAHDPATLVDFDPRPQPSQRVTLRYEYADGLRALGIDVLPWRHTRDRLLERDRGEGFARAPAW